MPFREQISEFFRHCYQSYSLPGEDYLTALINIGNVPLRGGARLPRLIRYAMKADTDAVPEASGKNGQAKKVFRALFAATAGLALAEVAGPAATQKFAEVLAGLVP